MEFKSNKAGICPFCGSEELEYRAIELEGEMCYFPWTCPNCKHEGEEWYSLEFTGHNIIDDNNECIEVAM